MPALGKHLNVYELEALEGRNYSKRSLGSLLGRKKESLLPKRRWQLQAAGNGRSNHVRHRGLRASEDRQGNTERGANYSGKKRPRLLNIAIGMISVCAYCTDAKALEDISRQLSVPRDLLENLLLTNAQSRIHELSDKDLISLFQDLAKAPSPSSNSSNVSGLGSMFHSEPSKLSSSSSTIPDNKKTREIAKSDTLTESEAKIQSEIASKPEISPKLEESNASSPEEARNANSSSTSSSAIDSMDSNRKFTSDLSSQDFMETPDLRNENSNTSKMEEEDDTFKLLKDSGVPLPDQDEKSEAQKFGSKQEGQRVEDSSNFQASFLQGVLTNFKATFQFEAIGSTLSFAGLLGICFLFVRYIASDDSEDDLEDDSSPQSQSQREKASSINIGDKSLNYLETKELNLQREKGIDPVFKDQAKPDFPLQESSVGFEENSSTLVSQMKQIFQLLQPARGLLFGFKTDSPKLDSSTLEHISGRMQEDESRSEQHHNVSSQATSSEDSGNLSSNLQPTFSRADANIGKSFKDPISTSQQRQAFRLREQEELPQSSNREVFTPEKGPYFSPQIFRARDLKSQISREDKGISSYKQNPLPILEGEDFQTFRRPSRIVESEERGLQNQNPKIVLWKRKSQTSSQIRPPSSPQFPLPQNPLQSPRVQPVPNSQTSGSMWQRTYIPERKQDGNLPNNLDLYRDRSSAEHENKKQAIENEPKAVPKTQISLPRSQNLDQQTRTPLADQGGRKFERRQSEIGAERINQNSGATQDPMRRETLQIIQPSYSEGNPDSDSSILNDDSQNIHQSSLTQQSQSSSKNYSHDLPKEAEGNLKRTEDPKDQETQNKRDEQEPDSVQNFPMKIADPDSNDKKDGSKREKWKQGNGIVYSPSDFLWHSEIPFQPEESSGNDESDEDAQAISKVKETPPYMKKEKLREKVANPASEIRGRESDWLEIEKQAQTEPIEWANSSDRETKGSSDTMHSQIHNKGLDLPQQNEFRENDNHHEHIVDDLHVGGVKSSANKSSSKTSRQVKISAMRETRSSWQNWPFESPYRISLSDDESSFPREIDREAYKNRRRK